MGTCLLFFIFKLTCCKFVPLKENTLPHYFQNNNSKKTKHLPQWFHYRQIRIFQQGGLQAKKFELRPSIRYTPPPKIVSPHPFPDHRPHLRWPQMPSTCICSCTVKTCLKCSLKLNPLNTKQCPAGLSPRIKPLPIKNDPSVYVALLPPLDVDCPPFLLTFVGNPEE